MVVGESLADDAQTFTLLRVAAESRATSPPVADAGLVSPPRAIEAVEGAAIGGR
jgi:hypothetical protein